MLKKILLALGLFLFTSHANCMNEKEKIIQKNKQSFSDINKILKTVGLLPDLCKIIGQYESENNYQIYQQIAINERLLSRVCYCQHLKYLALYNGREIEFFDLDKDMKSVDKIILQEDHAFCLTYNKNNKYLALGGKNIYIYDMDLNSPSFMCCISLIKSDSKMFSLQFSSDGKFLCSIKYPEILEIWNTDKTNENVFNRVSFLEKLGGRDAANHPLAHLEVDNCKFFPMGYKDLIKLGSIDSKGAIKLSDFNSKDGHKEDIAKIVCKNKLMASFSLWESVIKIWDFDFESNTFGDSILTINSKDKGHNNQLTSFTLSEDNKTIITSGYDNTIKIWDLNKNNKTFGDCIETLNMIDAPADCLESVENGKFLICYDQNKKLTILINMKNVLGDFKFIINDNEDVNLYRCKTCASHNARLKCDKCQSQNIFYCSKECCNSDWHNHESQCISKTNARSSTKRKYNDALKKICQLCEAANAKIICQQCNKTFYCSDLCREVDSESHIENCKKISDMPSAKKQKLNQV